MCEGKGYTEDQCSEVGCCQWDEECWSAVGSGSCDGGPLDLSSGPVICDTRHFSSASSHKVKAQLVKFKRKDSPEEGDMCSDSDRQALFSMVDVDSSGSVSLAELAAAVGSEAVAVMCAADADGDGMMSYEEFSAWAVANFCSQQGGQQEEYEWTN